VRLLRRLAHVCRYPFHSADTEPSDRDLGGIAPEAVNTDYDDDITMPRVVQQRDEAGTLLPRRSTRQLVGVCAGGMNSAFFNRSPHGAAIPACRLRCYASAVHGVDDCLLDEITVGLQPLPCLRCTCGAIPPGTLHTFPPRIAQFRVAGLSVDDGKRKKRCTCGR
jgi:hypothetical protein